MKFESVVGTASALLMVLFTQQIVADDDVSDSSGLAGQNDEFPQAGNGIGKSLKIALGGILEKKSSNNDGDVRQERDDRGGILARTLRGRKKRSSSSFSNSSNKGKKADPTAEPTTEPTPAPTPGGVVAVGNFTATSGNLEQVPTGQIPTFIDAMGGDPAADFYVHDRRLLSDEQCGTVKAFADTLYEQQKFKVDDDDSVIEIVSQAAGGKGDIVCCYDNHRACRRDFKILISAMELEELIGWESIQDLYSVFSTQTNGTGVSAILIRRVEADGEHIAFHIDSAHSYVLQVPINSEDVDYSGGKLAFLNSEGIHYPPRPAGSAVLHDGQKIVHGVTKLESGIRYGLFLIHDPYRRPEACMLEQAIQLHLQKEIDTMTTMMSHHDSIYHEEGSLDEL